jgi:hypothetical protein
VPYRVFDGSAGDLIDGVAYLCPDEGEQPHCGETNCDSRCQVAVYGAAGSLNPISAFDASKERRV